MESYDDHSSLAVGSSLGSPLDSTYVVFDSLSLRDFCKLSFFLSFIIIPPDLSLIELRLESARNSNLEYL